ncbi:MAG TPA: hypothetical protein VFI65_17670, partial [Streptosporangiaceae bacterium]|nr:hypothetical protein [Streptosporangiaceae bacterium]
RYCVALLLASDPVRIEEAAWLLIEVAGTGHALALDLLDARRDGMAADEVTDEQGASSPGAELLSPSAIGDLSPYAAAQHAYELACKAWDRRAEDEAYMFCRAAARGGLAQATLGLAQSLLAGIDPEAATWLGSLGTERAVGRHRSDEE